MSQPTPHVAEKELFELRDHMKGCKSCPVGVPCVIAFNIRLKISEKEIQRLTREVEILEPCVRTYSVRENWSNSIGPDDRELRDCVVWTPPEDGFAVAESAISQFEGVRKEK